MQRLLHSKRLFSRQFGNSTALNSRRTSKLLIKKAQTVVPERDGFGTLDIATLTGNLEKDGVNRYELDLLESVEFTRDLILKMMNDGPKLKSGLY
jgi:hypothetical protein